MQKQSESALKQVTHTYVGRVSEFRFNTAKIIGAMSVE